MKVGEVVNLGAMTQAFHALRQTPAIAIARVRDRTDRLMCHVYPRLASSMLSLAERMAQLSLRRRLIAATSGADLLLYGREF